MHYVSQLVNLLARVKASVAGNQDSFKPGRAFFDVAMSALHDYIDTLEEDNDLGLKVLFSCEPIKLLQNGEFARSYSAQLTLPAYLLNATSAAGF